MANAEYEMESKLLTNKQIFLKVSRKQFLSLCLFLTVFLSFVY